jgi:hypothetical protein
MRAEDEINMLGLLDQAETSVRLNDAIDLRDLVARKNHEQVGKRSDAPVLEKGEPQRLRAVTVTALAEELGGSVTVGADNLSDPLVDFAQKHLATNELFERNGHRVLPSRTLRRDT